MIIAAAGSTRRSCFHISWNGYSMPVAMVPAVPAAVIRLHRNQSLGNLSLHVQETNFPVWDIKGGVKILCQCSTVVKQKEMTCEQRLKILKKMKMK